jgi:2-dehydro-3-deoxygalactonokinase
MASSDEPERATLVGIDWGSSNLRVALLDAEGRVLARRESAAGVFSIRDGDFASALWPLCGDWVDEHRLPMLACGMIGSRQGAVEVPYVACPAGVDELAGALGHKQLPASQAHGMSSPVTLFVVPGLNTGSHDDGWDVVRGEETQLLGATAATGPAGSGNLYVLPGTHSKWMVCGSGARIESFQTYMTGELFELLHVHSSLGRMMSEPRWSPEAFQLGVGEARDGALENLLFRVRTAGLMGRIEPAALADYLSGLLIGAEVKAGLQRFAVSRARDPIAVIGGARLTQRYALALASFGLGVREVSGDAVFAGLLSIARRAGLLNNRRT